MLAPRLSNVVPIKSHFWTLDDSRFYKGLLLSTSQIFSPMRRWHCAHSCSVGDQLAPASLRGRV
jgi:hypothetical protein